MNPIEINNFLRNEPLATDVLVTYLITTSLEFTEAALKLCKEQSLSNALGQDLALIKTYAAKYIPSSITPISSHQFTVNLVFPTENCENSLSMMLSAVAGDTHNIKDLYPIKVLEIKLPEHFIRQYPGPQFGVAGLREKLNIPCRPILIAPVKPCIGLKPAVFAERAKAALQGGADIVKDDELICDPDYNRLAVRVRSVAKVVEAVQELSGEKKMYFAFIGSGSPAQIMQKAVIAQDQGADGFMMSPAINGLELIKDLRSFGLPIIAHNALVYASCAADHGLSFADFALCQRLCGADLVITPAPYGTFAVMTHQQHLNNIRALNSPLPGIASAWPAFCGGQSCHTLADLKQDNAKGDFALVVGTSLFDHVDGPKAGARALRATMDELYGPPSSSAY